MLQRLFPNEREFFREFTTMATRLAKAAGLLENAFENPSRQSELCAVIQHLDQETDVAAREIEVGTDRLFIPPMDREDIHLLSTRLRRIVDIIGGTARRAVTLRATRRDEPGIALARTLVRATTEIEGAVEHLREGDIVLERCRAIKRAEEEGDAIWAAAMTALFAGVPDPLEVLRWKTIYDQLEEALDACDDVANELETITVKHA